MVMMSAKEASTLWGISTRRVTTLCSAGKIPGASKENGSWQIPVNAEKPADARVRTGAYKKSAISNLDWYTIVKSEGPQKPWPNPNAGRDEQLPVYLTMTLFPSADDYRTAQPLYLYYGEIFGEAVESFTINGIPCDLGALTWPESVTAAFPSSAKTKLFILVAPEISWPPSYSINDRCSG